VGDYSYNSSINDREDRFVLHLVPQAQVFSETSENQDDRTETQESSTANNPIIYYGKEHDVFIKLNDAPEKNCILNLYDINGRLILTEQIADQVTRIYMPENQQVMILKLVNGSKIITEKILNK